jgi:quinol monooxygenase YgiN
MFAAIMTMKAKPEEAATIETLFCRLAGLVHANEPGTPCYHLVRGRDDPAVYKLLVIYESEEAAAIHRTTRHHTELAPGIGPCLDGPPSVEFLDAVR